MSWRRRVLAVLIRPAVVQRQGLASSKPLSATADHQPQDVIGWWNRTPLRSLSTPSFQSYQRPASVKKQGIAHVQTTFSNTVITVTDLNGNTKSWASSGSVGFKGCKRASKFAAQAAAEHVAKQAVQLGYGSVEVRLKGATGGKDSSVRGLQIGGLSITRIRDVTPVPHNGCRLPKKRRV